MLVSGLIKLSFSEGGLRIDSFFSQYFSSTNIQKLQIMSENMTNVIILDFQLGNKFHLISGKNSEQRKIAKHLVLWRTSR